MNVELFKQAIAVIEGIPDARMDLDSWQKFHEPTAMNSEQIHCETICCAGGWLALYPPFQALGLHVSHIGVPVFQYQVADEALALFFDLSIFESGDLFDGYIEDRQGRTDREVWLDRAKALLKKYS